MKKLFALIVAVCMLLNAAAYAEVVDMGLTLQDEQPPKLWIEEKESGEAVAATIFDKDGNVLAEIPDDGTLELTDVHFRALTENAVIVERLTAAYENVMDNVHHSDVDCKLHEHDVQVDINDVLASLQSDADAHDLVMYELYDVMLNGDSAALLTDGAYIEATFELLDWQPLPLIILYSADGVEWQVIGYTAEDGNRFTVKLEQSGTLALLSDGRELIGIGKSNEQATIPGEIITDEEAGDNFTPSVTGKSAPTIAAFTDETGERYIGYLRSLGEEDDVRIPDRNYVLVTAVAERDYIVDIQTHEHLEWGYDRILEAEDVGDLFTEHDLSIVIPDHEHGTIAGLLDETLTQMGSELTHSDLVVKDLFEVTAYGDYVHYLYNDNYYLDITLETDLNPTETVVVLHSADSKHWHIHPIEEFAVGADGSINLKLYDLGAIALLVEASDIPVAAADAVTSPN